MNRNTGTIALLLLSAAITGCHSDTPKAAPTPVTNTPASATTAPKPHDCATITDPALAEDCRFRAEVLKKRQASRANPVNTHAPGTIKQP